jgi:hypothetical protein
VPTGQWVKLLQERCALGKGLGSSSARGDGSGVGRVDHDLVPAGVLGGIERLVGGGDQLIELAVGAAAGDAGAEGRMER